MLEWLIIGGGLHGSIIAQALLSRARVGAESLRVLDPHDEPLAVWREQTRNCGMQYLRSPAAHAIAPDFTAMLAWARRHGYDRDEHTIPPYARPSLELFNAHSRATIESSGLRACWIPETALALDPDGAAWAVRTSARTVHARRIVLAPGRSDGLNRPRWAVELARDGGGHPIHVFDRAFDREKALESRNPVVVGGGVSAVHLALLFARVSDGVHDARAVRLVTRHEIRVHQFDSDPCYIGPSCMRDYLALEDPELRRSVLARVRNPGSIPPDLKTELDAAVAEGRIRIVRDEIVEADRRKGVTTLRGRRGRHESDIVVLATGLAPGPPAHALIAPLARAGLPVDSAGYPVPDASLQWSEGLYVTGALGEQELGPSAPNIIGAHNSAKRIIAQLGGSPRAIPGAWRHYGGYSASSGSVSSSSASSASD